MNSQSIKKVNRQPKNAPLDFNTNKQRRLFEEINVQPGELSRIALGTFTAARTPKGYALELSPDPDPPDSIVTQVVSVGTAKRYRLVLQVANYGTRAITVRVREVL